MRLRSLFPALALLALTACDSNGALKIAQAPAPAPTAADCCCKAPSCPPAATPAVVQPPVMAPEPAVYQPAVQRPQGQRRPAALRVVNVQRHHAPRHHERRDAGDVRQYAYAGGLAEEHVSAPIYDSHVEVSDRRLQGHVVNVEAQDAYREGYSEQSESSGVRYAERGGYHGGYDSGRGCGGCAPREAAGRDRNGFLTWPGKVPARP